MARIIHSWNAFHNDDEILRVRSAYAQRAIENRLLTINEIREAVKFAAGKYCINRVDLYGSYYRGNPTRRSDVDLLVSCVDDSFFQFQRDVTLKLKCRVDVFIYSNEPPIGYRMDEATCLYQHEQQHLIPGDCIPSVFFNSTSDLRMLHFFNCKAEAFVRNNLPNNGNISITINNVQFWDDALKNGKMFIVSLLYDWILSQRNKRNAHSIEKFEIKENVL